MSLSRLAAIGTSLAGAGAAATAAVASLCCVGPAVVSIVGVSGAVACPTRAGPVSRTIVWIAALIWVGAVLSPFIASLLP